MAGEPTAARWFAAFMDLLRQHDAAPALREAALAGKLGDWTRALTGVVVDSAKTMGWQAAAKGHRSTLLPMPQQEYLGLDVVAFVPEGERRWRFPVAVFELENDGGDDRVAYSLWKVLCVRAALRVVFCYRRDNESGGALVRALADAVIRPMAAEERAAAGGETLLVVGSRADSASFPYGFFKDWSLDLNTVRFARR